MASAAATHLHPPTTSTTTTSTESNCTRFLSKPTIVKLFTFTGTQHSDPTRFRFSIRPNPTLSPIWASSNRNSNVSDDGEDGVLLGTLKLPPNTDLERFEILLFQWANSLCQGATLPLPMPLKLKKVRTKLFDEMLANLDNSHFSVLCKFEKVDRVEGGARLGFAEVGSEKAETPVYIDCLVFPPEGSDSGPVFRAIRNGPLKGQAPPGEPRIMRSLLQALQKSAEIARN